MTQVQLRIADLLLLQWLFRLPPDVTLEAAAVRHRTDGSGLRDLLLTVDMPGAPSGAAYVDLTYTRRNDLPDPLEITGTRWFRTDGTEITGTPAP